MIDQRRRSLLFTPALIDDTIKLNGNHVIMRISTLLRVANACFVLLILVPVVAATAGNRSGDGTNQPNESSQISMYTNTNVFSPVRVDRSAITIAASPFNALGRLEMSEYQNVDLNGGSGPARAGCIGYGCDEKAPPVIPSFRALGKGKKCKGKKKEKPEEECKERDEDGCCIDEEGKSNQAGNDIDGDVGSDSEATSTNDGASDENETSDSDENQSRSDSNEDGKDGDKEKAKEEAEAREKVCLYVFSVSTLEYYARL